jgi:hypothetical protein
MQHSKKEVFAFLEPHQIIAKDIPFYLPDNEFQALVKTVYWAYNYLCKSHPDLGRNGAVCPYTSYSLNSNLFWLTVYKGDITEVDEVIESMLGYKEWFIKTEPVSGELALFKTALILFPSEGQLEVGTFVDYIQKALKTSYVRDGLMIGQFFEGCKNPGIWNSDFHPLQSPVPLLAIRYMTPSDLVFLSESGACKPEKLFGRNRLKI